jgi:hypothetical protein
MAVAPRVVLAIVTRLDRGGSPGKVWRHAMESSVLPANRAGGISAEVIF